MNYFIENEFLKVEINAFGAELQSAFNKQTGIEYLWNGDANFWGKKSPVLFPIVGGLKNNEYEFEGKKYTLNRHGFAREMNFGVELESETKKKFSLSFTHETLLKYPFKFAFEIEYYIEGNKLFCSYNVFNTDEKEMYFSIGAHPAFALPMLDNTEFEDWYIETNKTENCGIYPLTKDGLLKTEKTSFFNNTNKISLTKELFYKDALVFKDLQSNSIAIKSSKTNHGLEMNFEGFPFFGIWSAKDANFVCLEPWLGIADSENTTGKLQEKEGIIYLQPKKTFKATWSVVLF